MTMMDNRSAGAPSGFCCLSPGPRFAGSWGSRCNINQRYLDGLYQLVFVKLGLLCSWLARIVKKTS